MSNSVFLNFAALAALVPAALMALRRDQGRDALFMAVLGLAIAGPALWAAWQLSDSWHTGLSTILWVIIAVSMAIFGVLVVAVRQAWRLTPLLLPYLLILGLLASAFSWAPAEEMAAAAPAVWLEVHILVSVATFGLLTMAAVAALAGFLQERALKAKRPTRLTRMLPSVVDSERLSSWLLLGTEIVLGLGLATGMATLYAEQGRLFVLDHKNLLSLLAFLAIGGLLAAQRLVGLRGRLAARLVLLAYLMLMLALPGVKFVTQVLLA